MQTTTQREILAELERLYPDAVPALDFTNAYEMLLSTILSAQCTDKRVNMVTPALFKAYPDPEAMAKAQPEEIEPIIHPCGCYHTKAKNIVATCRRLVEKHGGQVPQDMEELMALPGVGRKTANVVMANAFGAQAIAVDTHVFRVSNRLGLADAPDVLKTELQLQQVIPQTDWSRAHLWLIYHGRRVCGARKPDCQACTLKGLCAHYASGQEIA